MNSAIVLVAFLLSPSLAAADPCLHYDVDGVQLRGTVELRTFFGPPGFGESPKSDRKEKQALLALDQPICVSASGEDEPEEHGQAIVTLVPMGKFSLVPFAGKHVYVSGSLFHAITGHHHTNVLISLEHQPHVSR